MKKNDTRVRDEFDGPIIRRIEIHQNRSGFALASALFEKGERDLTVYQNNRGKAGQVLTGRHPEGWYIDDTGVSYQHTTAGVMGVIESLVQTIPNIMRVTCFRCGHQWFRRTVKPKDCPRCGSRVWDRPRTGNEPGPKPRRR